MDFLVEKDSEGGFHPMLAEGTMQPDDFVEYKQHDLTSKHRARRSLRNTPRMTVYNVNKSTRQSPLDVALLEAVARGENISTIKKLLKGGASACAQEVGQAKRSALHIACSKRNVELVKLLLSYGASLELRDILGNRPLDIGKFANAETVNALTLHSDIENKLEELSHQLSNVTVNQASRHNNSDLNSSSSTTSFSPICNKDDCLLPSETSPGQWL